MKLAVFGATGKTGRHVVEQAVAAGHHVIAFTRTPSKLQNTHARLTTVQGDVQNAAEVEQAIIGADAVISVLGPTHNRPTFEVSKGTTNILRAMEQHGVRRLVVSAGAGVGDPQDAPKLLNKAINVLLKLISGNVYADMQRTVELVRASDRDWVITRVPMLTDQPRTSQVKVGYVGKGMGVRLARADMAGWMLEQARDDTYLRKAPAISN
jgi:nucleoside-diphosphate-sugar epimerase